MSKHKNPKDFGDDTKFLLELFEARKKVKTKDAVKILGSSDKFFNGLKAIRKRYSIDRAGYGLWELVE